MPRSRPIAARLKVRTVVGIYCSDLHRQFSEKFVDPVGRGCVGTFYAGPGEHPETATLCSAPIIVLRKVAAELGPGALEVIEGTASWAEPAGVIQRAAYEGLRDEILEQLKAALPVGCTARFARRTNAKLSAALMRPPLQSSTSPDITA